MEAERDELLTKIRKPDNRTVDYNDLETQVGISKFRVFSAARIRIKETLRNALILTLESIQ